MAEAKVARRGALRQLVCTGCGDQIVGQRVTKRFCEPCRLVAKRANGRRHEAKVGRASTVRAICCPCCRQTATAATGRQKYCDACVSRAAAMGPSAHYYLRHGFGVGPLGKSPCAQCGTPVEHKGAQQRFCSRRCRGAARLSTTAARLNNLMRASIYLALKGRKRGRRWSELVGYTTDDLRVHIERQFSPQMSWDNFGRWHIDHVQPLASFKFEGPDDPELRAAWALSNLRPLWAGDNIRKKARRELLL